MLAVDGNSLGHRAFHSVRDDPAAGPHAVTGAVVSMLASAWRHGPYDGVLVAFDHEVNVRRSEHPEYKGNRPANDERLRPALRLLREDLEACGLRVEERPGAEADDVLVAAADGCTERGWACDVLSSDRDLTVVVGPGVRLLRPRATFADLHVEDVDAVRATYGIEPHQYTDLAALRGDPSDGLEGARGIGPKTAARLLREHGNVLGIYAALHQLPVKVEVALREARQRVERNLLLMAPLAHLVMDLDGLPGSGLDVDRLIGTLDERGEPAPARRLVRAMTQPTPPAPPPPPPPWDGPAHDGDDLQPVRRVEVVTEHLVGEQAALF